VPTFYRGHRPIIRGRNSNDAERQVDGKVGEYSNFDVFNTSQALDGFPDRNVEPGAGAEPGDVAMSRRFRGLDTQSPMDAPGLGPDTSYMGRMVWPNPVASSVALGGAGHVPRVSEYSGFHHYIFQGVPSASPILDAGHVQRDQDEAVTGGGATRPWENQGVGDQALEGGGKAKPAAGTVGVYGHEHVGEWAGVPSARAL
jgi:hypothetical protein